MLRARLTNLANNPDLIPGIYNYCDRWCERCPLTSRCLVYATEQDETDSPKTHDITNEEFWRQLRVILHKTFELIPGWATQAGVDLNASEEHRPRPKGKNQLVDHHPLPKAAKKYATAASDWFCELDPNRRKNNARPFHPKRRAAPNCSRN